MASLISGWWASIWPNLAANIIWLPLGATHHVLMKRHVDRRHQELAEHISASTKGAS